MIAPNRAQNPNIQVDNGIEYILLSDDTRIRRPPPVTFGPDDVFTHSGSFTEDPRQQAFIAKEIGKDIDATRAKFVDLCLVRLLRTEPDDIAKARHLRAVYLPPQWVYTWVAWDEIPIAVWTPPVTRIEGTDQNPTYVARWEGKCLIDPKGI